MRKAAIIGITADGKSELLCGMIKYSDAHAQLAQHLGNSKFAELFLCDPGKRYKPSAPARAAAPEIKSKAKKE